MLNFSAVTAQNLITVGASDPNIIYQGRIDNSDPSKILFSYPGVSIKATFEGTQIKALLEEGGWGGTSGTNYFNVIIDEKAPTVLELSGSNTEYTLAQNLTDGIHTIELIKRTESQVGTVTFKGFQTESGTLLAPSTPLPERKIEFIGNSITCGYGNGISTTSPDNYHFTSINENNYNAWGAVAARNLQAQYSCVAYSGRGLLQNNSGSQEGTLPKIYDQIIADDASTLWDHSRYIPDVLVINLGTNDFAAEVSSDQYTVDSTEFVQTYITFISKLRTYYPCSSIICCVGTMMSDGYPSGKYHWTRIQNYVSSVRDYFNNQNDSKVFYLKLSPQQSPYGEDWHPTEATHLIMANTLVDFINDNVGWQSKPEKPIVVSPINYTVGEQAHILEATGTNITWYNETGDKLENAPLPETATAGTLIYRATQTIGGCVSNFADIQVIISENETPQLQLTAGWNLIGYPFKEDKLIENALESIWDKVEIIKNMDSFYIKDFSENLNLLRQVQNGEGYLVKVSDDCMLTWK